MENIFYNIISILVGLILVYFGVSNIKNSKKLFSVLTLIHALLFLGFGITGFFLPKEYQYITVLSMLAFCITMGITILVLKKPLYKKEDKNTHKAVK